MTSKSLYVYASSCYSRIDFWLQQTMAESHNFHEVTERLFEDREDTVHCDWGVTTFMKSQRGYLRKEKIQFIVAGGHNIHGVTERLLLVCGP